MMKLFAILFLCSAWNAAAASNEGSIRRELVAVNLPEEVAEDTGCFSGTSTVWVENIGEVMMKNLEIGDRVLTGKSGFQPVYSFGHHQVEGEATFFQIYTDKQNPLEMTGNHLVHVVQGEGKEQTVRADTVKGGDQLIQDQEVVDITKVTTTQKQGLYMPLTADGTIVVNGILASNYVSIQEEAPAVVAEISQYVSLSQDAILHWWLSPYRMLCLGVSPSFCNGQNKDESGILQWLLVGKTIVEFADEQNWVTRVVLIGIPAFTIFAVLNLMETILGGPALAPMVALVLFSGLSWLLRKRRSMVGAKKGLCEDN